MLGHMRGSLRDQVDNEYNHILLFISRKRDLLKDNPWAVLYHIINEHIP